VHVLVLGLLMAGAEATRLFAEEGEPGVVRCGNMIYGNNVTSRCFSDEFLRDADRHTHAATSKKFTPVRLDSEEVFQFPFTVMTGEAAFALPEAQRENLRRYLLNGGFLVASAGCSSSAWAKSFRNEIKEVMPEAELRPIDIEHPIFHTAYDIRALNDRRGPGATPLECIEIEGRIVAVFSADGLNDTAKAGGNCCCCGGNEIRNAKLINVNLLAYALTH
jgi:hypothetical protein